MEKRFATLKSIENNRTIKAETDYLFLFHLKRGILLALKELGILNLMQYRYAEENLIKQRQSRGKKLMDREEA